MIGNVHSIETFGSVDGPGIRLVVFLQGCPMRCAYCHNPDTWEYSTNLQEDNFHVKTDDEILLLFKRNRAFYKNGGITVSGGEPLLQIDFVISLFTKAKKQNIHTCLDTSGICFEPENPDSVNKIKDLLLFTDLVMLDIKQIDEVKHIALTGKSNKTILAFATFISAQNIPLWIRHVVVPGLTDSPTDLINLGRFIGTLPTLKALDVLAYHDLGKAKYKAMGIPYALENTPIMNRETAIQLKRYILQGIKEVLVH